MAQSSIEVHLHLIPSRFIEKGVRKVKLYILLRYSIGRGKRKEKKTGLFFIVPESAYEKKRIGTIEDSLPHMFADCNEKDRRHNKATKSDLEHKKSELLYELHYEVISVSARPEKMREARQTEFLSLFGKFIDYLLTVDRADGTVRNYEQTRDKIARFNPNLRLGQISVEVIIDFQKWLHEEQGLSKNTTARHMTALNSCMNWLVRNDFIEVSPFMKLGRGDRYYHDDDPNHNPELRPKSFFSPDELKIIWEQRYNRKRREDLDSTLAWLFSNMTGLRHCDASTLSRDEIKSTTKDGTTYQYIEKFQGKTKRKVLVPLNRTAQRLLEEVKERNPKSHILAFRINANRNLKFIRGTDKQIRYHNARHSFGNNLKRAGVQEADIDRLSGRRVKGISEKNYADDFVNNIDYYHELVSRIDFL